MSDDKNVPETSTDPNGADRDRDRPSWLRRLLGQRNGEEALRDTLEELLDTDDAAEIPQGELDILRNLLTIRDKVVADAMVPRADIVAVPNTVTLSELVSIMSTSAHSRVPIYRDNLDDVIGMVHIKDVMAAQASSDRFRLSTILRRMLFVAPSMPVLELLLQMRVRRIHMAIVVDEFGGVDGLLTIEDLVEEIVGEIEDEHDEESTDAFHWRPDGSLEVDARYELEAFEAEVAPILNGEERDEDIETLGGLVFFLAGRVPARGEVIRHHSGAEFEVLDADPRRIKRLRVCNPPKRQEG